MPITNDISTPTFVSNGLKQDTRIDIYEITYNNYIFPHIGINLDTSNIYINN